jgi:hypothetical protein
MYWSRMIEPLSILMRRVWLLIALLLLSTAAHAREVAIPVRFSEELIRQYLIAEVFTGADTTARAWDDGSGCNFLTLSDPQVAVLTGAVRVTSAARAQAGTVINGRCLTLLDWAGFVEVTEQPVLGTQEGVVEFRVMDSKVYGPDGERQGATGVLWDWLKSYVHPRLEAVRLDINPTLAEIKAMVPVAFPADEALVRRVLESVSLSHVDAGGGHVELGVRLNIPEKLLTPKMPETAEPALTEAELERWTRAAREWDAFLTLIVKRAGTDASPRLRATLLATLLDARREMVAILAAPPSRGVDPVRRLFLDTWSRLAPVLREESAHLPPESALRWLSLIAAADALQAIDALGAELGFKFSADALRRLARIAVPDLAVEPLDYSDEVDPELRRALGFGAPLPPPRIDAGSYVSPMFFIEPAQAADPLDDLAERLNGWVPTLTTLDEYLPLVSDLLDHVVALILGEGGIGPEYQSIFRPLVLATAWQESCWRQYVEESDKYVPISSGTGSIGIMQVNQYVWRGFYDIQGLRWDIAYNARAGAEILRHYLMDYAVARADDAQIDDIDELARATYAMYNGGPGHMTRFLSSDAAESLRAIDAAFWEKYQVMKATENNASAVARCYAGA